MTYDLWAEVEEVGHCLLRVGNDVKNGAKMSNFTMKYWLTHKSIVHRITEKFGL